MSIWKEYFVSANGCDCAEGTALHPFRTLNRAAEAVRRVNTQAEGDIIVHLYGEFNLDEPFVLRAYDSGFNGHKVIYRGEDGASVTGYKKLNNWVKDGNGIWHACAQGIRARQLFLDDGIRLVNASAPKNPNWKVVPEGYECNPGFLAGLTNPADLEFSYNYPCWEEGRLQACGVKGDVLLMKQPAFKMAAVDSNRYSLPDRMYNAYEFINGENQWCVDTVRNEIYCRFAEGIDPNEHTVRLCALDHLVVLKGTLDAPIHDIIWDNVTFRYATWLVPNDCFGLIAIQANCRQVLRDWRSGDWGKPLGTVLCYSAKNCAFTRNTFCHMGATALSLEKGCCDNLIEGNRFFDIGNGGIMVGDDTGLDAHPYRGDARIRVRDNRILNNYLTDVGVDHPGVPAITVWYTTNTEIGHNEIAYVPYSGISLGWGWGGNDRDKAAPTIEGGHYIHHNHIHHMMLRCIDGGAVYLLGSLPGTLVSANCLHDQPHDFGTLYYDDGTQWITMSNNVVYNTVRTCIMKGAHNSLFDNYCEFDENNMLSSTEPSNTADGNHLVPDLNFPLVLVDGAGLEKEYQYLLPKEFCLDKARFKTVRTFDGKAYRNTAKDEGHGSYAVNGDGAYYTDTLGVGSGWLLDLGRGYTVRDITIAGKGSAKLLVEATENGCDFTRLAVVTAPAIFAANCYLRNLRLTVVEGELALNELGVYEGNAPARDGKYADHELELLSSAEGKAYVGEENVRFVAKGIYADGYKEPYAGETAFTVSDGKLAAVDNSGAVTAKKAGKVTVSCAFDGVTLAGEAEIYLDVIDRVTFRADRTCYHVGDSGTFEGLSAAMISGRSCDLKDCKITYASDNEAVVAVTKGGFRGVAPGIAAVTATYTYQKHQASVTHNITIMPNGWDCALIGRAEGEFEFDGESWRITNSGENVFSAADHFSYLYHFVNAADYPNGVTVETEIDDIDNLASGISMSGVMIRPRINADSMCVSYRYQVGRFVAEDKRVPWQAPVTMRMQDYFNTGCAGTPNLTLGNKLLLTYKDKTVYLHQQIGDAEPTLVYTVNDFDAGERFSLGCFYCSGKMGSMGYACGSKLTVKPNTLV